MLLQKEYTQFEQFQVPHLCLCACFPPVQLMRMPVERPSSSLMFFRLFSASSTVLHGTHTNHRLILVLQGGEYIPDIFKKCCTYVRKSLTSSTVSSPVESRVRSAQLRGESSGVSRMGEERALGGSSVCPVRGRKPQSERLQQASTSE